MSDVTQIGGGDPNTLWIWGALALGLAIDLALGDLPGRSYPIRWMDGLIETVEDGVRRTVVRLGGGRGGDLFGGLLLTFMVVGTASGMVWLVVNLADEVRGPIALGVRALLIAAGLAVRSTGDRILQAAEATDRQAARNWLAAAGGQPPTRLDQLGADQVCIAAVGELTATAIVAPLFWLALGGPAAMWGFLAIRSLRQAMLARDGRDDLAARVTVALADLAEAIPALLACGFMTIAAASTRMDAIRAGQGTWRTVRQHPRGVATWGQATLAGALGVRVLGGRVYAADLAEPHPWLGDPGRAPEGLDVIRAVRIMQISALCAAALALVVTIFW